MRLYEFSSKVKTYIARVKLKNGATVTATERTESLSYARQIFQHKYGDKNVFNVTELNERMNEIEEATQTKTPEQLQVQALADKAKSYNQQAKMLKLRQKLAKDQQALQKASLTSNQS